MEIKLFGALRPPSFARGEVSRPSGIAMAGERYETRLAAVYVSAHVDPSAPQGSWQGASGWGGDLSSVTPKV